MRSWVSRGVLPGCYTETAAGQDRTPAWGRPKQRRSAGQAFQVRLPQAASACCQRAIATSTAAPASRWTTHARAAKFFPPRPQPVARQRRRAGGCCRRRSFFRGSDDPRVLTRGRPRRGRAGCCAAFPWVAVLAIGIAIGVAMMATPVSGDVGTSVTHLWNAHLKSKTDARYSRRRRRTAAIWAPGRRRRMPTRWTGSTRASSFGERPGPGGDNEVDTRRQNHVPRVEGDGAPSPSTTRSTAAVPS